jgi:Domain of unknown function (DUF4338)
MMNFLGNQQSTPSSDYDEWCKKQTFVSHDIDVVRSTVLNELNAYREISTGEYVLWQKWEEVNNLYPMHKSALFDEYAYVNKRDALLIPQVKSMMWAGDDYESIEPELIYIGDKDHDDIREHWTVLRVMIHTQQHSGSVGRGMSFLVRDKITQKYLGVVGLASDFLDLAPRDNVIGWTRDQRTHDQRIKHTAVCSTIVPVQPFGYNFVGGKLLALLCLSDVVRNKWKELYGSHLAGVTTTSLYGKDKGGHGMSQYDNLKHWKKMGYSTGKSPYRMSLATKKMAYEWIHATHPETYYRYMIEEKTKGRQGVRDRLNRLQIKIYGALKIRANLFTSNHDRGIYFSPLYTNTNEFLRADIPESALVSGFPSDVEYLTGVWKKYAAKRIANLTANNRVSSAPLYYDDMGHMGWAATRERYLKDVGR